MTGQTYLSQVLGQTLGGVLYIIFGPLFLFFTNAISYLLSSISEMFISVEKNDSIRNSEKVNAKNIIEDIKISISFIKNNHALKSFMVLVGFMNLFYMPVFLLLPFYMEDNLKLTSEWYGYILAANGLGGVAGTLFVTYVNKVSNNKMGLWLNWLLVVAGALMITIGIIANPYVLLVPVFFMMLLITIYNIIVISNLQANISDDIVGKIFGFLVMLNLGLIPLGRLVAGFLIEQLRVMLRIRFHS